MMASFQRGVIDLKWQAQWLPGHTPPPRSFCRRKCDWPASTCRALKSISASGPKSHCLWASLHRGPSAAGLLAQTSLLGDEGLLPWPALAHRLPSSSAETAGGLQTTGLLPIFPLLSSLWSDQLMGPPLPLPFGGCTSSFHRLIS